MTSVYYLKYDRWIKATYKLLDYVAESAKTWHEMPGYRKGGRLLYLKQLEPNLAFLRAGESLGRLSRSQIRQLRNLERLAKVAKGTIKALQENFEAPNERRGE